MSAPGAAPREEPASAGAGPVPGAAAAPRAAHALSGFQGIFVREWSRFSSVFVQTVLSPVVSTMLYFFIFSHVFAGRITLYGDVSYQEFIVPGLIMMSVWQNAFANPSSSLMIARLNNSIVFVLLPPISPLAFFLAHITVSATRGMIVGVTIYLISLFFVRVPITSPLWVLAFLLLSAVMAGSMGVIAGIWADRFDQAAGVQNFVIMPLTFLSGVFYSIHSLPELWQKVSYYNPFLYIIDGFRYGFLGHSDTNVAASAAVVCLATAASGWVAWRMIKSGYKLRI